MLRCLFFSSALLSSLELNETQVYEPYIRAHLGTASHFCEVGLLKLRTAIFEQPVPQVWLGRAGSGEGFIAAKV